MYFQYYVLLHLHTFILVKSGFEVLVQGYVCALHSRRKIALNCSPKSWPLYIQQP